MMLPIIWKLIFAQRHPSSSDLQQSSVLVTGWRIGLQNRACWNKLYISRKLLVCLLHVPAQGCEEAVVHCGSTLHSVLVDKTNFINYSGLTIHLPSIHILFDVPLSTTNQTQTENNHYFWIRTPSVCEKPVFQALCGKEAATFSP